MSRDRRRPDHSRLAIAAALAALGALLTGTLEPAQGASPDLGQQAWAKRYNGGGDDVALATAASPDGARVFVTGQSDDTDGTRDYLTICYDAVTGAKLWGRRYDTRLTGFAGAVALAVSPDGSRVFVTGNAATVAYDTARGTQLWAKGNGRSGRGLDSVSDIAVGPTGSEVFVAGTRTGSGSADDYATAAYDAKTGARRWIKRYNGPANANDEASGLAVSPDGSHVFVTGASLGIGTSGDFATVAYSSSNGARKWVARYNSPMNRYDYATAIGVSPDGSRVYVTGPSAYRTIAYDAATGSREWVARFWPHGTDNESLALAVSPDGSHVFVTGHVYSAQGSSDSQDYGTVAYDAITGEQRWFHGYNGWYNERDIAYGVAVSPDSTKVFVTGTALETDGDAYTTIAYAATTGERLWRHSYYGPNGSGNDASALAVTSDGTRLIVTGRSWGAEGYDYATVAYGNP